MRVDHIVLQPVQDLFGAVYVAHRAVAEISRSSRRTHRGIPHLREVVMTAAKADDDVWPPFRPQVLAGMNSMNQQIEIDALRGLLPVLRIDSHGPARYVRQRRIVAKNAHRHFVAVFAMGGDAGMALIALGGRTTSRRGCTGVPSTVKCITLFCAPY